MNALLLIEDYSTSVHTTFSPPVFWICFSCPVAMEVHIVSESWDGRKKIDQVLDLD